MMSFSLLEYLADRNHLKKDSRILDVGSQNLINCTVEGMVNFVRRFRSEEITDDIVSEIKRQHYFSTPRAGERTLFVGEFLALTDLFYVGIDVCPAPNTQIVDLNLEGVREDWRQPFDILLNLGTTEHLVNQINAHAYMHDAAALGAITLHQPPSVGWCNHGYFAYHPLFFRDLAEANSYEIVDMWYGSAGRGPILDGSIEVRNPMTPQTEQAPLDKHANATEYYNLNVIFRKNIDVPFKLKLELATSHATVDPQAGGNYTKSELSLPSGVAGSANEAGYEFSMRDLLADADVRAEAVARTPAKELVRAVSRRALKRLGLGR